MQLETQRLLLRPVKLTDAEDMYEYSKNPDVGPNAGWAPHTCLAETKEIIRSVFLNRSGVWGICLKEDDRIIGTVGLTDDTKRANPAGRMLGYSLSKAHWGKGYMTEAAHAVVRYGFEALKLDLISAYCFPYNQRSSNVMRKLGFEYEGRLKMATRNPDGRVLDNDCYVLTAERYFHIGI